MENLKSPAYPVVVANESNNKDNAHQIGNYEFQEHGFTKLEKAALMIAAGYVAATPPDNPINPESVAEFSVRIAAAVLEEANT